MDGNGDIILPDEILYMICQELCDQKDLDALFQLSLSCRRLLLPALSHLYRRFGWSSATYCGRHLIPAGHTVKQRVETPEKGPDRSWAHLWQSVILSSLGKTIIPYCHHVRTLDFGNLDALFDDIEAFDFLFDDNDMEQFFVEFEEDNRVATRAIIRAIGDALTKATPLVNLLIGDLSAPALALWLPRLPQLAELSVTIGSELADVGGLLRHHCTVLRAVRIMCWQPIMFDSDPSHFFIPPTVADADLARFLREIRPQLTAFEMDDACKIGALTLSALASCHRTLTELKLRFLTLDSIQYWSKLADLTNLSMLQLGATYILYPLPEADSPQLIIAWLRQCKHLRDLRLNHFERAFSALTSVLSDDTVQLVNLDLEGCPNENSSNIMMNFCHCLPHQQALESVTLHIDGFPSGDSLAAALAQLPRLRHLCLIHMSDEYNSIAKALPQLEELRITGTNLDDSALVALTALSRLRHLEFQSEDDFSVAGLLDFVAALRPAQAGFVLTILAENSPETISKWNEDIVDSALKRRVGGRFSTSEKVIQIPYDSHRRPRYYRPAHGYKISEI